MVHLPRCRPASRHHLVLPTLVWDDSFFLKASYRLISPLLTHFLPQPYQPLPPCPAPSRPAQPRYSTSSTRPPPLPPVALGLSYSLALLGCGSSERVGHVSGEDAPTAVSAATKPRQKQGKHDIAGGDHTAGTLHFYFSFVSCGRAGRRRGERR